MYLCILQISEQSGVHKSWLSFITSSPVYVLDTIFGKCTYPVKLSFIFRVVQHDEEQGSKVDFLSQFNVKFD